MGLEGLLSELLVSTVLDSVQLKSVGVGVDIVVLGEKVRDGVEGGDNAEGHAENDLGVGNLGAAKVRDVLSNIVGHRGCGSGGTVIILNHTVVELGRHGDNHVIVVGVEITTLGHIKTEWW